MNTQLAADQQFAAMMDQAVQLILRNDITGAEQIVMRLLLSRPNDCDAMQLLGTVRYMQQRLPEAEQLYRRTLAINKAQPRVLLNLGHLLRPQGRFKEAIAAYNDAVHLEPQSAHARFYLAVTLHEAQSYVEAERAYRQALTLDPNYVNAMVGLGALLNDQQKPQEAEKVLTAALSKTEDVNLKAALEHNIGIARNMQADHEGAIRHFDRAIAYMPNHHGAEHSKADALQHLGREDEAVEAFRRAIKINPLNFGAHRDLNGLLYRLRRDNEFLKSYDEGAARLPQVMDFPLGKAAFMLKQEKNAEAREIFARVHKVEPHNMSAIAGLAVSNANLKNFGDALAAYDKGLAIAPNEVSFLYGVASIHLMACDAKKAAEAAERALAVAPHDQTSLAILGTAWRLQNDEREYELNRYEDFIQVYDLEPPEGYSDMDAFNRDLNAYLDGMHPDAREYIDQSLRNGTQTLGNIFNANHDLVNRLRVRIEQAVARYIREMPEHARHPLLSRKANNFKFTGSWSSRLRDCGYHTDHIHPGGWISSAYYIALPETVADADAKAGWIKFGQPGYEDLGLKDPVRRAVQPQPGRLVLFPSYMWHGTVPFRSEKTRTTIAFDAVPLP